ncbi:hypothetical protein BKA70DRAFT_1231514 [Coprinopsis sp. MPI-PUGE-AT-0042]|nr:hypothetical protein BKA70DRAFT_1231514 [Coprinopsis sp. MPI-PUGE-AT-0042]
MSNLEATADWQPTNGSVDEGPGRFSFAIPAHYHPARSQSDSTTLVGHFDTFPPKEKGHIVKQAHLYSSTKPTLSALPERYSTTGQERLSQVLNKRSSAFNPPLGSEEFKTSVTLLSSATSKLLTPSSVGDLSPLDVGKIMEEHGTSLMIYHLSVMMHQQSGRMLANIREHANAIFGDGNWIEHHSHLLNPEQHQAMKEAVGQWKEGYENDWREIVDHILLSPDPLPSSS